MFVSKTELNKHLLVKYNYRPSENIKIISNIQEKYNNLTEFDESLTIVTTL